MTNRRDTSLFPALLLSSSVDWVYLPFIVIVPTFYFIYHGSIHPSVECPYRHTLCLEFDYSLEQRLHLEALSVSSILHLQRLMFLPLTLLGYPIVPLCSSYLLTRSRSVLVFSGYVSRLMTSLVGVLNRCKYRIYPPPPFLSCSPSLSVLFYAFSVCSGLGRFYRHDILLAVVSKSPQGSLHYTVPYGL